MKSAITKEIVAKARMESDFPKSIISPKEEQKLPYDIIELVRTKCVSVASYTTLGQEVENVKLEIPEWNGNSDDVKEIRKMMRKVYVK